MSNTTLVLIAHNRTHAEPTVETHANRLRSRNIVDTVHTAWYDHTQSPDLTPELSAITADTIYAYPLTLTHTYDTLNDIPTSLNSLPGTVHYCDPIGQHPALTPALVDRATSQSPPGPDTSLALVGFGSSSLPYQRQTVEYYADRLRETTDYAEIVTSYLLQNPAVECVRYNLTAETAVVLPVFLLPSEATEHHIPDKLELDRGGLNYADPIGTHKRLTDAIHASIEHKRILAQTDHTPTPDHTSPRQDVSRVVTDGDGRH